MKLNNLNQTDIARLAGVSRQAVSLWMKTKQIQLRSQNLKQLSDSLHISVDDLLKPLPILDDQKQVQMLETSLLWDRLYTSLDDFVVALTNKNPKALARLIQVYGMYASSKICGKVVWKKFQDIKKYIHPVRRAQCEILWKFHENPDLI